MTKPFFNAWWMTAVEVSVLKGFSWFEMCTHIKNAFILELLSLIEGDIGVCGIAVLANFSCGISVIFILNCGIAVFSKPAGCVFFTFWSTIFGIKPYPSLFSDHL